MTDYNSIIDLYYPVGSRLRDIYMCHCRAVADHALAIVDRRGLPLDHALVERCAMLHDIGIVRCHAPSIECNGTEPYIRHGIIGAEMLRELGADQEAAGVAERHTGSGLTAAEIVAQGLPLPKRDFVPQTLLERLICYSDKFFSKSNVSDVPAPLEKVRAQMARFGEASLARFDALHAALG